jgi:hypothetical protein
LCGEQIKLCVTLRSVASYQMGRIAFANRESSPTTVFRVRNK